MQLLNDYYLPVGEHPGDYRLLDPATETLEGVLLADNFVDPESCRLIIEAFEASGVRSPMEDRDDGFFDNRTAWLHLFPDSANPAKQALQNIRHRTVAKVAEFYKETEPLYSDTIQVVCWPPDFLMPAHADNCHPDPTELHPTPHRKYASIVYLNDDYEGGELFISTLKVRIKPKTGLFVAFTGGMDHMHGVMKVTQGTRYTAAGWFTNDVTQKEFNHDEVFV